MRDNRQRERERESDPGKSTVRDEEKHRENRAGRERETDRQLVSPNTVV